MIRLLFLLLAGVAARAAPLEVYAAGDIAACGGAPASQSNAARTAALIPRGAPVLVLGDTVYPYATTQELETCYRPTWGRHLEQTLVVPGNHDYKHGQSTDFQAFFAASPGAQGYFAQRLGTWLIVGLDSSDTTEGLIRQYAWLETALAENADARCIAAMWHKPVFSSGIHQDSGEHMRRFWRLLDAHGADLVLNGHEHYYEAFDPQNADGVPTADGPREFVVGTGGALLRRPTLEPMTSRARLSRHGVLRLTLDDGAYEWAFIDVKRRVFDPGQAACRSKPGAARAATAPLP